MGKIAGKKSNEAVTDLEKSKTLFELLRVRIQKTDFQYILGLFRLRAENAPLGKTYDLSPPNDISVQH